MLRVVFILIFFACHILAYRTSHRRSPKRHIFRLHGKLKNERNIVEEILQEKDVASIQQIKNLSIIGKFDDDSDKLLFPEIDQSFLDEKTLRKSNFGKILFSILEIIFPIFREPNWFDKQDPPLTEQENINLPYFDGYDFVNSSWTIHVRHRFGAWNWLDRMGMVPQVAYKVFFRPDGIVVWSDGYYGNWYINPAINYFQLEKQYASGYGYAQQFRGMRILQIQRWNFEDSVGRYWQRGLRSSLRNETNYWAFEGRVWGAAMRWRGAIRDQGKFIAIRDGTNLSAVFGNHQNTPWQRRFEHAMSLPFYQAHPDQLERIEDNFDMYYRNLLGKEIR